MKRYTVTITRGAFYTVDAENELAALDAAMLLEGSLTDEAYIQEYEIISFDSALAIEQQEDHDARA